MYRTVMDEQIRAADLPARAVYDLVRKGFELHGRGQFEFPAKQGVHTRPGAFTHAMPAYLPSENLAGTKLISIYPDNAARGLSPSNGVIVMMDPDTGVVSTILDATWITNIRTAMVSMMDAAYLANPDPVFGIVGATGGTGRAHVGAIAAVFPGSRVLVNSRSRERCDALVADFPEYDGQLVVTMDQEALVKGCDVVIVCTSHLARPILQPEWLRPGQNVLNVHTRAWPARVLDAVDVVSCDDRRQVLDATNGLTDVFPDLSPDVELGQVVIGTQDGRTSPTQTIMSFNYGLPIFDLLVADYVLRSL